MSQLNRKRKRQSSSPRAGARARGGGRGRPRHADAAAAGDELPAHAPAAAAEVDHLLCMRGSSQDVAPSLPAALHVLSPSTASLLHHYISVKISICYTGKKDTFAK
jgi:hypothetical protein